MLAEIHGKISSSGSNLTDRLEDNLTGMIFGSLRYLSFQSGIGKILAKGVNNEQICKELLKLTYDMWAENITFWPYDKEGEIDVIIEFESVIIGIEVKYQSGLSSDDEVYNIKENTETNISKNQLARESNILKNKAPHKQKILLFIADRTFCKAVCDIVMERNIIAEDVALTYISWQDFLYQMKQLTISDSFQRVAVQDMIQLLSKKGFDDFNTMSIGDAPTINAVDYFSFNQQKKTHFKLLLKRITGD
ncbi:hypothetical protein ACFVT8_13450 [Lysinibacillus sp. NPDC058147]|uniref:hypothetical protein n=1 Tax=unclassified Lysinibacillus TaxID=2636778 RepID=UPI0036DA5A30